MKVSFDFWEVFADIFKGEWRDDAYCIDNPHEEIFLDEDYEAVARGFCEKCKVTSACLDNAIEFNDGGFRGGMNEKERQAILMHRRRHSKAFQHDLEALNG